MLLSTCAGNIQTHQSGPRLCFEAAALKETGGNVCLRLRVRAPPAKSQRFTFHQITMVISSANQLPYVRCCFVYGHMTPGFAEQMELEKKVEYRDKKCHFCYLAGFLSFPCFFLIQAVLIAYRSNIINNHMLAYKERCMSQLQT